MSPARRGRCQAPGSLGRHVYGPPDPHGVIRCDCGACTRRPATPAAGPVLRFLLRRVFADGALPPAVAARLTEESPA